MDIKERKKTICLIHIVLRMLDRALVLYVKEESANFRGI
jgi:hypothetical protein